MRLAALDDATGQQVLNDAKTRIETLAPEAFSWWGEVVCAVGTKVRS
jgi:hypothetical protein